MIGIRHDASANINKIPNFDSKMDSEFGVDFRLNRGKLGFSLGLNVVYRISRQNCVDATTPSGGIPRGHGYWRNDILCTYSSLAIQRQIECPLSVQYGITIANLWNLYYSVGWAPIIKRGSLLILNSTSNDRKVLRNDTGSNWKQTITSVGFQTYLGKRNRIHGEIGFKINDFQVKALTYGLRLRISHLINYNLK